MTPPRRFARIRPFLVAGFSAAAVLLGMEFSLRRLDPAPTAAPSDQYVQFLKENSRPFFRIEGGELVQTPTVWAAETGQRFSLLKPPSVRRVLVVGESSAALLGRELRRMLAASPVSSRLEVMNCGVSAGSVEIIRHRFDEAVRYSPDAVIVAVGHNTFYDHPLLPPALLQLSLWANRSRLVAYLGERVRRILPDRLSPERRLSALRDLVEHIASEARSRGIPVIVVVLPSNLWFAPTAGPDDLKAPAYLQALYLYHSERKNEAVAALKEGLSDRQSALWQFTLGDWLYRGGNFAEALGRLALARDLDMARSRSSQSINALLREVAGQEGLLLLDGQSWVARQAPHGVPGWESFLDSQHVRPRIFRQWALECLRLLKSHGWTGIEGAIPREAPKLTPEDELHWALSMIPLEDETVRRSLTYMFESRLPATSENADASILAVEPDPYRRSIIELCLAEAFWRLGQRQKAFALNAKVGESRPRWAQPNVQRGLFYLETGAPAAALASFQKALREEPERKDAAFFLQSVTSHR